MVLGPIDTWNAQTLDDLVANQWQESMVLEFKRQLGTARGDKKETAKDISAMANTSGGWIVYGIDEQANANGIKVAQAVTPLTDANTAQRIDDIAAGPSCHRFGIDQRRLRTARDPALCSASSQAPPLCTWSTRMTNFGTTDVPSWPLVR